MSDEPDVTVNVTASLEGLEKSIGDIPKVVNNATKGATVDVPMATPRIIDSATSTKQTPEIQLPDYKNESVQLKALIDMSDRLADSYAKLEDAGEGGSDAAERMGNAMDEIALKIEELMSQGVQPARAPTRQESQLDVEVAQIEMPELEEPEEQLSALQKLSDQLSEIINKYEQQGRSASRGAQQANAAFDSVLDQIEELEEQMAAAEDTAEDIEVAPDTKPSLKSLGALGGSVGTLGASFGRLGSVVGKLGSVFSRVVAVISKIPPPFLLVAAAIAAVLAVVAAIVVAMAGFIKLMKAAISAANAYEKTLIKLAGSLGSAREAQIALNNVDVAIEGMGVDKESVRQLIPMLESQTRGVLNQAGGLDLIVDTAARIDPKKVDEIGNAIASAYATLRTGGNAIAFNDQLVQMGIISGETARQLEMMQKRGANQQQTWAALVAGIRAAGDGAVDANQTMGGAWNRISTSIANAWKKTMEAVGSEFTTVVGPALSKLAAVIEAMLPRLGAGASVAATIVGKVADMVASVIEGIAFALHALQSLANTGQLGKAIGKSAMIGLLMAANAFIDALAIGVQYTIDAALLPFKMLTKPDFWKGLGNALVAMAGAFIAKMAAIKGVLLIAAAEMIAVITAGLAYAADKANPFAKANFKRDLEEARGTRIYEGIQGAGKQSLELAEDSIALAFDKGAKSLSQLGKAAGEDSPLVKLAQGKYKGIDALGDMIDEKKAELVDMVPEMPSAGGREDRLADDVAIPLADVVGQAGPKSVADSLQSVGGGGFSFGISWQDRMLEETKTQNATLSSIDANTSSTGGAFGSSTTTQESPSLLLSSISQTVSDILTTLQSGSGGPTVKIRS